MLRSLVCAEFGYRSDEQWGYTIDGSACCYIRDVNSLLENDFHILRQVVAMYPNLKWFIIGGCPCQDLTFAGSPQGLLGLVGAQSRLFFVLLCTIRTMQVLVGPKSIRYLVENAGSMKLVHYVACCKLLGLPHEPLGRYIWELAQFIPYISRKRNFFRNFLDTEPVQEIRNFFDQDFGPLLNHKGKVVPFAPLLRTRAVNQFGICHSSWTLYQPHALVWDYSFWGGRAAFASVCKLVTGKHWNMGLIIVNLLILRGKRLAKLPCMQVVMEVADLGRQQLAVRIAAFSVSCMHLKLLNGLLLGGKMVYKFPHWAWITAVQDFLNGSPLIEIANAQMFHDVLALFIAAR